MKKYLSFLYNILGLILNGVAAFLLSYSVFLPSERTDLFSVQAIMFVVNFFGFFFFLGITIQEFEKLNNTNNSHK